MDLVLTLDELQKARRYVSDGQDNVARQRKIVEWLEGQRQDALDAICFWSFSKSCRSSTEIIATRSKGRSWAS